LYQRPHSRPRASGPQPGGAFWHHLRVIDRSATSC